MSEQPVQPVPPGPPVVDRRRHRRWLTKRNVLLLVAGIVAVFLGLSVWSEIGGPGDDDYGRLYSRRTSVPELPGRRPYDVVAEQEIEAQGGVDPLLVEGMRREQVLGVEPGMLEEKYGVVTDTQLEWRVDSQGHLLGEESNRREAEIAITGGPEGVRVEKKQ
ncbi:MAG: hypothetical protein ACRD2J_05565 [Thermoanaerobaculia bacterium]